MTIASREAKGLLLYGPAGTGKADMARALADQLSAVFINRMASELASDDGFHAVRAEAAHRPALLFVEGLDVPALAARRTTDALLREMDGLSNERVLTVISVSRPDRLDPALLRGGRFAVRVPVGLPDLEERLDALRAAASGLSLAADADLAQVARETGGLSKEQLAEIVRLSARLAAHRGAFVGLADFRDAVHRWAREQQRRPIMSGVERIATAYHEAGHALVSNLLTHAEPVSMITIMPHGLNGLAVLGITTGDGHHIVSRAVLVEKMAAALAGRAAEELATGHVRPETDDDVEIARRAALSVVERMVGGDDFAAIEREVSRLLADAAALAHRTLAREAASLDALAAALLDKETLRTADIARLLPVAFA